MSLKPKQGFFKTRAKALKVTCLVGMLLIPFGLYYAALAGSVLLIYSLLGLLALTMALLMRSG